MGISFEINGGKRLDEVLVICCVLNKKTTTTKTTQKQRVAWMGYPASLWLQAPTGPVAEGKLI